MLLVRCSLLMLLLTLNVSAAAVPSIVVSIQPLHSLVSGVMSGMGTPHLLVTGGQSPHQFSLRPSQARKIEQSDLLIWVGPELEGFLPRIVTGLGVNHLALLESREIDRLPVRSAGLGDVDDEHEHEHEQGQFDSHIWLDPHNAKKIVAVVAHRLAQIDPDNHERYRRNAVQMYQRLDELDQKLEKMLASVRTVPYFTFHDAYQYFEKRYGLNRVGAVMEQPGQMLGVRRTMNIKKLVRETGVVCIFREPQFRSPLMDRLLDDGFAREGVLDPMGVGDAPASAGYFALMERLARSMVACLERKNGEMISSDGAQTVTE